MLTFIFIILLLFISAMYCGAVLKYVDQRETIRCMGEALNAQRKTIKEQQQQMKHIHYSYSKEDT